MFVVDEVCHSSVSTLQTVLWSILLPRRWYDHHTVTGPAGSGSVNTLSAVSRRATLLRVISETTTFINGIGPPSESQWQCRGRPHGPFRITVVVVVDVVGRARELLLLLLLLHLFGMF